MSGAHPYERLTPDVILAAVESLGPACDGRLQALNSYENRVYQIGIEDSGFVVAKFYRPERWSDAAIMEEHAFVAELAAAEIPAVAPLAFAGRTLNEHGGFRFAVYPRQGGRPPEFDDPATLEWMGRLMGRIHAVGRRSPFSARPTLDIAGFGQEPRDYLLGHAFLPPELEPAWRAIADQALDAVRRSFDRAGDVRHLRLHGDCHAGNVLWTDAGPHEKHAGPSQVFLGPLGGEHRFMAFEERHEAVFSGGPHFVDFDDSRMGPAVQDMWMLFSGDAEAMAQQRERFLAGYGQFMDFDRRELYLIEALRTLRLLHYSAWIARRWDDPAFPTAFPWFNSQRYWQDRILELREQVGLMQEDPL
jgi:Ser/Thr protein kinase RdoA (MazF antagonist)